MNIIIIVALLFGTLSQANPGVLEQVAERRMMNGWGLEQVNLNEYDALIATPDCAYLGKKATIVTGRNHYKALVVDCSDTPEVMQQRNLVADINIPTLVHSKAYIIIIE